MFCGILWRNWKWTTASVLSYKVDMWVNGLETTMSLLISDNNVRRTDNSLFKCPLRKVKYSYWPYSIIIAIIVTVTSIPITVIIIIVIFIIVSVIIATTVISSIIAAINFYH